jgi:hypothetical protein
MRFDRITAASQLKDGGQYLIVCSAASNKIMLPSSVTKSNSSGSKRIGFDLGESSVFIDDTIYGEYDSALWTFTSQNGRWLIGDGKKYATLTSTSDYKITATFEDTGSPFSIRGTDSFTFFSGINSLNYNARELINGYEGDPASFFIFEYVGYAVSVEGGSAPKTARPGDSVTAVADTPAEGMEFDKWVVSKGEIELADPTASEITFVMPRGDVVLEATYKELPLPIETEPESEKPTESSSSPICQPPTNDPRTDYTGVIITLCIVACAIVGVVAFVFIKKSKK